MSESNLLTIYLILNGLKTILYGAILLLAAVRLRSRSAPAIMLFCYAAVAFGLHLFQLAADWGFFPWITNASRLRLEEYAALLLAAVLFQELRTFLGREEHWLFFIGSILICGILIVFNNILLIFILWIALTIAAILQLLQVLLATRQHLHRNRLLYWLPVLLLAFGNDSINFYRQGIEGGSTLRLGAIILMAYAILRHNIPDTRDFARQFLIYFIATLISMGFYIGGFLVTDLLFHYSSWFSPLLVGAGLAALISILFNPMFRFVRSLVNRLFRLPTYDPSRILRDYGASISNIVDLEKLAIIAIDLIKSTLDVDKGYLFIVDPEVSKDDKKVFRLSSVRGSGLASNPGTQLSDDSPIVYYIHNDHHPLLQYDLDFSVDFLNAPLGERRWFSSLELDVYVPIFARSEWIGLLALGPKPNSRYTNEDLNMLATMGSQTAVALENARLVENLKRLNSQVHEAYAYLDKANHDLARLEVTKSNFISIASHELRTPLTVAKGYVEMLLENEALDPQVREMAMGIHNSILRQHEIMDTMFDLAQLDARLIELEITEVIITEVVRTEAQKLSKSASERNQDFSLDLPELPIIRGDSKTLRKLFYHLLQNAIKFTPNNGQITITGNIAPANGRDLPEGGVEIIISDTGVGIDKESQEIIFTKFYQPQVLLNRHSTGKTKFKGSGLGLGLALSRAIVEAHGGRIWVESQGNDEKACPGSSFHVILPVRQQGESNTIRIGSAVKLKL